MIQEEDPQDIRPMVMTDAIEVIDDALKTVLGVPRVFLPLVLKGCVEWTRENNVELITEEHMKIINDKRSKEKNKK